MSAVETMSEAWLWLHIAALAVATFALRLSFISLFSYIEMPASVKVNLKLVPPAVLAALAAPPFVFRDGSYHLSPTNPFLLTGLVVTVVAWKTESLVLTLVVGFGVFFALTYVPVL